LIPLVKLRLSQMRVEEPTNSSTVIHAHESFSSDYSVNYSVHTLEKFDLGEGNQNEEERT